MLWKRIDEDVGIVVLISYLRVATTLSQEAGGLEWRKIVRTKQRGGKGGHHSLAILKRKRSTSTARGFRVHSLGVRV